jgi:hypothetical protein
VIGIGFYSNLFGYGLGGILSGLIGTYSIISIENIMLFLASLATLSFFLSAIFVKNKPKISI